MKSHNLIGSLLCLLVMSSMLCSQSASVSGDIRGMVSDPSGAVLAKVTVTTVDTQTGLQRTTMTDAAGQYRLTGLPPATYELTARVSGFGTEIRRAIGVGLGQTITVDFRLNVSAVPVQIEVTDEPPVVETERGGQTSTVTERYIADLPIDRRDYLTFTLLTPAVSNSNVLADNADFRVKQSPQSGLSFYGSNGRGNSISVDGGEANDDVIGGSFAFVSLIPT